MEELNIPYVKKYDEKGLLQNPINGAYINNHPNRKERRSHLSNKSFTGNHKGISLTVSQNLKYKRTVQIIKDNSGKVIKTIKHYLAR